MYYRYDSIQKLPHRRLVERSYVNFASRLRSVGLWHQRADTLAAYIIILRLQIQPHKPYVDTMIPSILVILSECKQWQIQTDVHGHKTLTFRFVHFQECQVAALIHDPTVTVLTLNILCTLCCHHLQRSSTTILGVVHTRVHCPNTSLICLTAILSHWCYINSY